MIAAEGNTAGQETPSPAGSVRDSGYAIAKASVMTPQASGATAHGGSGCGSVADMASVVSRSGRRHKTALRPAAVLRRCEAAALKRDPALRRRAVMQRGAVARGQPRPRAAAARARRRDPARRSVREAAAALNDGKRPQRPQGRVTIRGCHDTGAGAARATAFRRRSPGPRVVVRRPSSVAIALLTCQPQNTTLSLLTLLMQRCRACCAQRRG